MTQNGFDNGYWPCYFSESDTTGEKDFEEFFTLNEKLDLEKFKEIGIIKNAFDFNPDSLRNFEDEIFKLRDSGSWTKRELVILFQNILPYFEHKEKGKYLDGKM